MKEHTKNKNNHQSLGILLVLLAGVLWGISGNCGQFLFQYKNATPDWLVTVRLTGSGILILFGMAIRYKEHVLDIWKHPRSRRDILIFGTIGMMLSQYSYFATVQYSNAGIATILQYTGPAMILAYTCIRMHCPPKPYELMALFCCMVGTFILATHGNIHDLVLPTKALLWGIISAITLVVYTLQPAWLLKKYSTLLTLGWGMLIGGIIMLVFKRPWKVSLILDEQTFFATAFVLFLGTISGFYCYLTGVKRIGNIHASMIACIEPVIATIVTTVWLKTKFQMTDLLGFIFVMSSVFLISLNQKETQS